MNDTADEKIIPTREDMLSWPEFREEDVFLYDPYSGIQPASFSGDFPDTSDVIKKTKYYRKKYLQAKKDLETIKTEHRELRIKFKEGEKEIRQIISRNKITKSSSLNIKKTSDISVSKNSPSEAQKKRSNENLVVLDEYILNDEAKPENKIYRKSLNE